MNTKRSIPLAIHILFCAIVLVIPLLVMQHKEEKDYWYYAWYLIRMVGPLFLFYFNYLYLIDKYLFNKKLAAYFVFNILLIIAVVMAGEALGGLIRSYVEMGMAKRGEMPAPPPHKSMRIIGEYIFITLFVGMSVALKVTARWFNDSIKLEAVRNSQLEADLRNLRNQLNPHFLFNTLNNIYSLIALDATKAQESMHRLSGLLRFVLYENTGKFVSIDKELEFTRSYIDLMALRLGENVRLTVRIENNQCRNEIASLMFMTLIENAFKHGVSNDRECFIDIQISVDKDKGVSCRVENSLNQEKNSMEAKNTGIGLDNLRTRLELLYPGRHQFEVEQTKDSFSVKLHIDFDELKTE